MSSTVSNRCCFFLIVIETFGFGWGSPPVFIFPKSDGSSTVEILDTKQLGSLVLSVDIHSDVNAQTELEVISNNTDIFKFVGKDLYLYETLDAPLNEKIHYRLTLRASAGIEETTTTVTIEVSDVSVFPLEIHAGPTTAIQEELRTGTSIGGLFWVEKYDDNITYNLSGLHSPYFMINQTSGEIKLVLRLDRESLGNYLDKLTVRIISAYGQTRTIHLNLTLTDINDNPPYCVPESYSIKVLENVDSGGQLVALNCSDDDLDDKEFTLEIIEPKSDLLYISNHDIHINNTIPVDVEKLGNTSRHINVLVKVTDNHTAPSMLSSFLNLDLRVMSVNEYAPVFTDPVADNGKFLDISVPRDLAPGTLIWTMKAKDLDYANDGEVEYYISSMESNVTVDISRNFYINQNGDLFTRHKMADVPITYGINDFNLLIGVRDKGDPVLYTENELTIIITDSSNNDTLSKFSLRTYYLADNITVSCQDQNGTVLTTLTQVRELDAPREDDFLMVSDGKVIFKGWSSDSNEDIRRVFLLTVMDDGFPGNLTFSLLKYSLKACPDTLNPIVQTTESTTTELASTKQVTTTTQTAIFNTKPFYNYATSTAQSIKVTTTSADTEEVTTTSADKDEVTTTSAVTKEVTTSTTSKPSPPVYASCEEPGDRKSKNPPYGLQALSAIEGIAICGCIVGFFIQHKLNKNLVKPFPTS